MTRADLARYGGRVADGILTMRDEAGRRYQYRASGGVAQRRTIPARGGTGWPWAVIPDHDMRAMAAVGSPISHWLMDQLAAADAGCDAPSPSDLREAAADIRWHEDHEDGRV